VISAVLQIDEIDVDGERARWVPLQRRGIEFTADNGGGPTRLAAGAMSRKVAKMR
jgi:hypothetical protein